MTAVAAWLRRLLLTAGWAPLSVFLLHLALDRGLDAYAAWPHADVPMHFLGGAAMCFFVARAVAPLLPAAPRTGAWLLEPLLAGGLTVTVAVFWEFAEFASDQVLGSQLQVSLANTMQDLLVGMLGAAAWLGLSALAARRPTADASTTTTETTA